MLYDYDTIYFFELFSIFVNGSSKYFVMANATIGAVIITIIALINGSQKGKSILRPWRSTVCCCMNQLVFGSALNNSLSIQNLVNCINGQWRRYRDREIRPKNCKTRFFKNVAVTDVPLSMHNPIMIVSCEWATTSWKTILAWIINVS